MAKTQAIHCFFDVFMGYGYESLTNIMADTFKGSQLKRGELATFINKSWTACKILAPNGTLIYHRSRTPLPMDGIRYLPALFGGNIIDVNTAMLGKIGKVYENKFKQQLRRIRKVEYA